MWNDEDNNPYGGSYERRDSFASSANPSPVTHDCDEATRHESTDAESDEDENARSQGELVPRTKPGGYDSRVEQMLYENPSCPF
ncbi:hypothetical protein NEMBOFW57_000958 [Staphylotrichum longicolle]|uniref:Uncharacterized protein n=1 Tax=Staphylotrichum longicolle TaxID=669026 RepID=A0AAD4F0M2_9PEZI|nr:hypothetical protein NEMBOFW57_000958 [Staphylotrichum longicolle]